jgi:hypothetical protein
LTAEDSRDDYRPGAESLVLVLDDLSAYDPASRQQMFEPAKARLIRHQLDIDPAAGIRSASMSSLSILRRSGGSSLSVYDRGSSPAAASALHT